MQGSDMGSGSESEPFRTISKAAAVAEAGDSVVVHAGEYREWVKPRNGGRSRTRRIIYRAADGEHVVIKGSERIQDWQPAAGADAAASNGEDTVWKVTLPNSFFGDYNPYCVEIRGDWLFDPDYPRHTGDVYLNGMSFYEAGSYEQLLNPEIRTEVVDNWTQVTVPVHNPEQTRYLWYAEVDGEHTTIYANFHDHDPNQELVEINVRKCCFYPEKTGRNYITVQGFEMCHAATPWTPPTADQPGLLGVHWSKGWIIEDNIIHDSKCSGISIGKEISTGHNYRTDRRDKPGYQYQLESVFHAEQIGWSKERIGSHIIRNNTIYDCGQNGIVGHLGCVFSRIHHNHIYAIALKREFYGHEIAGIKLHAAIDVQLYSNRIHDCSLGTWMDWQTQGTRISRSLYYRNNRDLFIEVSHGPYVVDHNILASGYALDNFAQGGAYVNNLVAGKMVHRKVLNRATPYHLPHSTRVAGYALVYGGDDRFYNNLFIGREGISGVLPGDDESMHGVGTAHFNGYTASLAEYIEAVHQKPGDVERFERIEQPVYIDHNLYLNGAAAFEGEQQNVVDSSFNPDFCIVEDGEYVYLECTLPDRFAGLQGLVRGTGSLPRARIVDADFENPDGSDLLLDTDLLGRQHSGDGALHTTVGPILELKPGRNKLRIW